jgi:hypothetical protein
MIDSQDNKFTEDVTGESQSNSVFPVIFGLIILGASLFLLWIDFNAFRESFIQLNKNFETLTVTMFSSKYFDKAPEAIGQFLGGFVVLYVIFFITTIFTWGAAKLLLFYKREPKLVEAAYIFFGPIGWIILADIFYSITG